MCDLYTIKSVITVDFGGGGCSFFYPLYAISPSFIPSDNHLQLLPVFQVINKSLIYSFFNSVSVNSESSKHKLYRKCLCNRIKTLPTDIPIMADIFGIIKRGSRGKFTTPGLMVFSVSLKLEHLHRLGTCSLIRPSVNSLCNQK